MIPTSEVCYNMAAHTYYIDLFVASLPGQTGRVLGIRGWDNETLRSVANVLWPPGVQNIYRVGHKGKVDLRYIVPATLGSYYPLHLPIAGKYLNFIIFSDHLNSLYPFQSS